MDYVIHTELGGVCSSRNEWSVMNTLFGSILAIVAFNPKKAINAVYLFMSFHYINLYFLGTDYTSFVGKSKVLLCYFHLFLLILSVVWKFAVLLNCVEVKPLLLLLLLLLHCVVLCCVVLHCAVLRGRIALGCDALYKCISLYCSTCFVLQITYATRH